VGSLWNRFTKYFRSKVISTSGSQSTVFHFRIRPMSGYVGFITIMSGVVENMRVPFGIALLSLSVQKLFLLPVYGPPF
jgi:hypothetical protein